MLDYRLSFKRHTDYAAEEAAAIQASLAKIMANTGEPKTTNRNGACRPNLGEGTRGESSVPKVDGNISSYYAKIDMRVPNGVGGRQPCDRRFHTNRYFRE